MMLKSEVLKSCAVLDRILKPCRLASLAAPSVAIAIAVLRLGLLRRRAVPRDGEAELVGSLLQFLNSLAFEFFETDIDVVSCLCEFVKGCCCDVHQWVSIGWRRSINMLQGKCPD